VAGIDIGGGGLPGIDPGGGGAVFPEDPGDPTGPGIVSGLDPDSIDPGWGSGGDEDGEPPPVPEEGEQEVPSIDAQWQTTRFINLSNARDEKVTATVTYETLNEDGELVEDTVEVPLDPGEVVELYQGDWRINARRVKLLVEGADGAQLKRFKDDWLDLVPETDENGVPGYPAPNIQTKVIAIR
jgi:hypothetical protein